MIDELHHHVVDLRRYAFVLCRDATDADDLVQETLLKAIAAADTYRPEKNLRAWLFGILHNTFVSHCRQFARRARATAFLETLTAPTGNESSEQERYVEVRQTLNLFARLSEEQRGALLLIAIEGLSYKEAAATLDVPVGTLMSRLSRGRERLRRLLEYGESAASAAAG